MIKVIFFDIDGTLVPMEKPHILDSTVKAFKALRSKGIHIARLLYSVAIMPSLIVLITDLI